MVAQSRAPVVTDFEDPTRRLGHQSRIDTGKVLFRSDFEGGNCWRVEHRRGVPAETLPGEAAYDGYTPSRAYDESRHAARAERATAAAAPDQQGGSPDDTDIYELWIQSDCMGTPFEAKCRGWFQFCMEKGFEPGQRIVLRIMNAHPHEKLYSLGMQPVWRFEDASHRSWQRVLGSVTYTAVAGNAVLDVPFTFESADPVRVCFTYPYPIELLQDFLGELGSVCGGQPGRVYYSRNHVQTTLEGHAVEVLTLTHPSNAKLSEAIDSGNAGLVSKGDNTAEIVFLSARVHPCEAPASHILEGAIRSLVNSGLYFDRLGDEPEDLLKRFVFKIVPMINPDGVNRGHSRNDPRGRNLNRYYGSPKDDMPSTAAVRSLFLKYHESSRLYCYIDMHAHHGKCGLFFYGNHHSDVEDQLDSQLFPLMISRRNVHYDFDKSNFSQKNMVAAGGKDGSKEGSARVALFHASGLVRCYTLEVNYNTSTIVSMKGKAPPKYTPVHYHEMGRDIMLALLDVHAETDDAKQARDGLRATLAEQSNKRGAAKQRRETLRSKISPAFLQAQQESSNSFVVQ
eukprot:TRINITY_DN21280_c0_g1_i1.p1 TRINITY_DN21280_c0_g1~~TRINITY_DN21280_c0_g1_i1.p1  ORF type:complete len:575 (+),score=199.41 TRINITY_DN21280_c0_g1_i1:26-1726(+)